MGAAVPAFHEGSAFPLMGSKVSAFNEGSAFRLMGTKVSASNEGSACQLMGGIIVTATVADEAPTVTVSKKVCAGESVIVVVRFWR